MEDIVDFIEIIKANGLALVGVVFLAIILNKIIDNIIPSFLKIFYKLIDKDPERGYKESYAEELVTAGLVDDLLGYILHGFHADRVYLFEYHNGGKNINNINFQKLSNTHEVVGRGIPTTIQGLQNLPVGMFAKVSRMIAKHQKVYYENVCDIKNQDESLHFFCIDRKAQSIFLYGVYDAHDLPIGFIGIEYINSTHAITTAEEDDLQSCADKIGGLLMGRK